MRHGLMAIMMGAAVAWMAAGAAAADAAPDFTLERPVSAAEGPLFEGATPALEIRAMKGWAWTPEQYLAEIPHMKRMRMNMLMNCYLSMQDLDPYKLTTGEQRWSHNPNRWWEELPAEKRTGYERVVKACQEAGIDFCFSLNPNLFTARPFDYTKAEDRELLWRHFAWMQGLGVKWFCIALDDLSHSIDGRAQSEYVNALLARLREKDPAAQMIFCPTWYRGGDTSPDQLKYLDEVSETLAKDIYCFWTGDVSAVNVTITAEAARKYKERIGHRLVLWENYPVNDSHPTLHLGPLTGRDPELAEVLDGTLANPLCAQNEIDRLPRATIAEWAWNPAAYDPSAAIARAIGEAGKTPEEGALLAELVDLYPGMLVYGEVNTAFNPVLRRMDELTSRSHNLTAARAYVDAVRAVADRMEQVFPARYEWTKKTIAGDVAKLEERYLKAYGAR